MVSEFGSLRNSHLCARQEEAFLLNAYSGQMRASSTKAGARSTLPARPSPRDNGAQGPEIEAAEQGRPVRSRWQERPDAAEKQPSR